MDTVKQTICIKKKKKLKQIKVNHFCFSGRHAALSGRVEGTFVGFCLVRV